MEPVGILTGAVPFIVLASALLTAPISLFLLRLYRRAVLRNMNRSAGRDAPFPPRPVSAVPPGAELRVHLVEGRSAAPPSPDGLAARDLRGGILRATAVYLLAGAAYAIVMAAAWLGMTGDGFYPVRFAWLLAAHLWPAVLALGFVLPAGRPVKALLAGYVGVLAAAVWASLVSTELRTVELMLFWFIVNGPATLLYLVFLGRRIRAVGPLVLAFVTAGVSGAVVLTGTLQGNDAALQALVDAGLALGLGAGGIFVLLLAAGFAAFALLGWPLLQQLGRRYERKRLSDRSLRIDALWLTFALLQALPFSFSGLGWVLAGPLAFLAAKLATLAGFAVLERGRGDRESPMLLLLRVFALGRRSEALFDELGKRWLSAGSVALIAGPDLATAVVGPDEFLAFAGGRLSRRFVRDADDLAQRLDQLDTLPDPDGRHRVNQFFCHADTWQATMGRLAARSDAVLMDLRSFSPANQGCRHEIGELLDGVPLARVVLLIDDGTDLPFLQETLRALWKELAPGSPNRSLAEPVLKVFRVSGNAARILPALLDGLVAPHRAPVPAGTAPA